MSDPPARTGRARSNSFHSTEDHPGELPTIYIVQGLNEGLGLGLALPSPQDEETPRRERRTSLASLQTFPGIVLRPLQPEFRPAGPRLIPQRQRANSEDVIPLTGQPPTTPQLISRPLPIPPPRLEPFHPTLIGIPTWIPASKPAEKDHLTANFNYKATDMERNKDLVFCQSKSFGTYVEIEKEGYGMMNVRLIFDMYVVKPKNGGERSWEEIQMRVKAGINRNTGCIGLLTACAASAKAITTTDKNDEPIFVAESANLCIRYLEVSRDWASYGIGKQMVELLCGQAGAHGMREAWVWPVSFRGDGDLGYGRDKAKMFFRACGFEYKVRTNSESYPSPYWKDLRAPEMEEEEQ